MSTKNKVLYALKEAEKQYVSGEELARRLSLSRTAIWKQINVLKSEGYKIESSSRLGYILKSSPNLLLPAEIGYGLRTHCFGHRIYYFPKIDSTNQKAKELAFNKAAEGTVIIAEEQPGGKGRLGRVWFSPLGGIWFSFILRPQIVPSEVLKITLLAGVAGAEAIQEITGVRTKIKWPNDILMEGKKVAGILTEMETEADEVHFVVTGIGINANIDKKGFPLELRNTSTSLSSLLGKKVNRSAIVRAFLTIFENHYNKLKSDGFTEIIDLWKERSDTLGSEVKIKTLNRTIQGKAIDIDEQGALVVKLTSGKRLSVWSGEIINLRSEG